MTCAQDGEGAPQPHHLPDNIPRANLQCPMVEVVDPYGGVMMIQRLWSPADIAQYAATLKNPTDIGGRRWTEQLQAFCRTYRPTMREVFGICAKNMEPSKMQIVLEAAQDYQDERPTFVRFEDNHRYKAAVDTVCEKIMTLFPKILNLAEVNNCRQDEDETVSQFRHRLEQAIFTHGGETNQNDPFAKAFLVSQLMNNMREGLSRRVKESLIGYKTADLNDIIKHATHAEEIEREIKEKEKLQKRDRDDALQLAMMDAVTKLSNLSTDKGENKNRYDNRRRGRSNYGCCFNCKSPYHWRSECPRRRHGRNGEGHRNAGHMREAAQTRRGYYDEREQVYRSHERDNREQEDCRHRHQPTDWQGRWTRDPGPIWGCACR